MTTAIAVSGPNNNIDGGIESITPANPVSACTILEMKIAMANNRYLIDIESVISPDIVPPIYVLRYIILLYLNAF